MPDREKVIEGLKKCAAIHQGFVCEDCEYPGNDCAIDDAIVLLKAQNNDAEIIRKCREGKVLKHVGDGVVALNYDWWRKMVEKCDHIKIVPSVEDLLKAQEPRVMSAAEVAASPKGTVLWVEEAQGVVWNLFPLEIETSSTHPDTGTDYLFFITYHDIRKFECSEYNQTWRCWTTRPSDAQREATAWE